jgi:hypothetical protein
VADSYIDASKTGFIDVKIMKEFAWIITIFFLNMAFGQVGEKY